MPAKGVSVLGCGWLGLPLAQRLISFGYTVKGSTTTSDKTKTLQGAQIIPYLFSLVPDIRGDVGDFFSSDILFLNIPFSRDLPVAAFYKEQVRAVVRFVEKSSIRFVIFASSTAVYPEHQPAAVEDERLVPDHERGQVLLGTEDLLRKNIHFDTTILRFAGLYGGQRKIGGFLSGKTGLADGDKPVNLVHLEDCIRIVCQIIQKDIRKEIFNICSDEHPTRRQLYVAAAQRQGLPVPEFSSAVTTACKIVSNAKIKQALNYQFQYPDPLLNV